MKSSHAGEKGNEKVMKLWLLDRSIFTRRPFSGFIAALYVGSATLLLGGCGTTTQAGPESRDQAAGVLLNSSAVTWQDIATNLQPNFQITGTTALQQIAPVTQEVQLSGLNATSVSAVIGALAGPTGNATNTTVTAVPNPQAPTGIPTGATLPTAPIPNTSFGIDPMLQYRAALALFQYVQELNSDLTSSTFTEYYVPYVVRLKITVVPYRQNLPYDLFARVSFFTPTNCELSAKTARTIIAPDACLHDQPIVVPLLVTDDIERAASTAAAESARQLALALQILSPYAQGTASGNSVKQQYQSLSGEDYDSLLTVGRDNDNTLLVRIGAAYQAVGASQKGDDSSRQNTRSLIGQNYDISTIILVPKDYFKNRGSNSLGLEVLMNSDFLDTYTGKKLPSRSHEQTVEEFDEAIVDAGLPDWYWYKSVWAPASPKDRYEIANMLIQQVSAGNFAGFVATLCQWKTDTAPQANASPGVLSPPSLNRQSCVSDDPEAFDAKWLWTRLAAMTPDSAYMSSSVDLPLVKDVVIPKQGVTVYDDGKTGMQVQLATKNRSIGQKLVATLTLTGTKAAPPAARATPPAHGIAPPAAKAKVVAVVMQSVKTSFTISLLSKSSSFDQTTGVLTFQFPSAAQSGVTGISDTGNTLEIATQNCDDYENRDSRIVSCSQLHNSQPTPRDADVGEKSLTFNVGYVTAPGASGPVPGIALASGAKQIAESNGTGTVVVYFPKWGTEDSAVLTVDGASVTSATGGTLSNGQVTMKSASSLTLGLINLAPGVPVTVQAEGKQGASSTGKTSLVLDVVSMQAPQHSQ